MVLIRLRVERVDQALTVRIIEGIVDSGRGNAEAGRGRAIDIQVQCTSAGLLIGGDVFQVGQLLQLRDELIAPLIQFVEDGVFQRVLVLGSGYAIVDSDVLNRLHVEVNAGDIRQLGLEAADHVGRAHVPFFNGNQVDVDAPAVQGG